MAKKKKYGRVLTEEEQKKRAEIIREGTSIFGGNGGEDYISYHGMTAETARKLIDEGFANPNDTQNEAPSFEEMTEFCEKHPEFKILGYVIGGDRDDARVTAEGVSGQTTAMETLIDFFQLFRWADEFTVDFVEPNLIDCDCWFD